LNIDNSNTSNGITIGTATSGVPISIGHTTSEVTVNDNLTVTGDLTVSGTTTTVNSTTVNLNDHNIVLDTGNTTSAVINGAGITIEGGSGDDATFTYNTTGPQFELKLGSSFEDLQTAKLTATELDISGDADIDGTLEADAITVNGTALNTVIAGVTVANATTAAVATTVTISDNESTNEDNAIIFTSGGDVDGGNIGLESDGDLTYNPSTGRLTATQLSGTLQTAAQGNVTSLGTLTTLTVDNVIINGSTIGHTGDTDLMTVASGVLTVAGEVDATSLDISGDADIDGTLEADAITVNGTALNTVIANEATALAIALG
jgi:cytoskeletal protein CcmA (bactofilin family)